MSFQGGKSFPGKVYCSNPLGNKHAKIAKNKTFVAVTSTMVLSSKGLIPDLKEGDYLCRTCKLRIYNFLKSLPVEHEIEAIDNHSDSVSESPASESDDEDFVVPSLEKCNLVRMLKSMNISCEELSKDKPTTSAGVKIYSRVKSRLQEIKFKLHLVTEAKTDLSPKGTKEPKPQKVRECENCTILLAELAERYKKACTKEEKYHILTTVPPGTSIAKMVCTFNCSTYMAKTASHLRHTVGVYSHPIKKTRIGLDPLVVETVRSFYSSDENSRVDPGQRNVVYVKNPQTGVKELQPKRVMWITLQEFHREFREKYPDFKISLSAISLLRPKNVVWAGTSGYHNSCTCIIHENFELLLTAAGIEETVGELLDKIYCSTSNDTCMFGVCLSCPDLAVIDAYLDSIDENEVKYSYWGNQPGTVGFQLLDKTVGVTIFKQKLLSAIPSLASHHYVAKKQKKFIMHLRENVILDGNTAVMQVDFSQNYSFVTQNAVAGHHWSNNQATVHPFVLTWYCKSEKIVKKKAFVVISDELKHDATTFHSFKVVVMRLLKKQGLEFQKIYFVSDGAASQFKCVKGFILLMCLEKDFGVKGEWHFYATSHGKSECDAIGATVKRSCQLGSLKRDPVTKAQINIRNLDEMVSYASQKLNSETVEIVKVTSVEVKNISMEFDLEKRYTMASTIPGTRMYHSFIPVSEVEIQVRRYSASAVYKNIQFLESTDNNFEQLNNGQFVAIQPTQTYAVGKIVGICTEFGEYEVELMQRPGKGNSFKWPEVPTIQTFSPDEVISTILPPICSSANTYRLKPSDYKTLNALSDKRSL